MQDLNIEQFRNLSDSEIRLVLTLAYLRWNDGKFAPLSSSHNEEIDSYFQYVKKGINVKDEI